MSAGELLGRVEGEANRWRESEKGSLYNSVTVSREITNGLISQWLRRREAGEYEDVGSLYR